MSITRIFCSNIMRMMSDVASQSSTRASHRMSSMNFKTSFVFVENSLLLCAKNVEKMLHYVRCFVQIHLNGLLVPELLIANDSRQTSVTVANDRMNDDGFCSRGCCHHRAASVGNDNNPVSDYRRIRRGQEESCKGCDC